MRQPRTNQSTYKANTNKTGTYRQTRLKQVYGQKKRTRICMNKQTRNSRLHRQMNTNKTLANRKTQTTQLG